VRKASRSLKTLITFTLDIYGNTNPMRI